MRYDSARREGIRKMKQGEHIDGSQKHPVVQPDRRLRARSRPKASDRRTAPRFLVDFPVQIQVGEGADARIIEARASDISDGGLRITGAALPSSPDRLTLRFHLPEGVMPEEYPSRQYELEGIVRSVDAASARAGVQFAEPLSRRLARTTWGIMAWGALIAIFASVSLLLLMKYQSLYYFWFDVPVFSYSIAVGLYLVSRFFFAALYRPPVPSGRFPSLTVLIPARNEEQHIERTVSQVFESDYPAGQLQVVVINDGSTDGTARAIESVRHRYPDLVTITFDEPRGKRQALAAGTRMAAGDLIVFVDSDSFLRHDALTRIVDGFVDPRVAAITGHCDVENAWANLLTRMQAVRYYLGFRIMKAAESLFDTVTCLSGPFTAYRREALLEALDAWVNQTFLGAPATYGDDRALTNLLMRRGWKLKYDARARCTTMAPEDQRTFLRQQLRWKRSWFRESLKACTIVWRREPLMWLSFYAGFILPVLAPAVVFRALIYVPLFQNGNPVSYLFGILLMSSLVSASYLFARRSHLWYYGIVFCFYYVLVLVWQLPYAILTCWNPAWGTRSVEPQAYKGEKA